MKRECKWCHCSIDHKHKNAKFCGVKCKDQYHNATNPRGYGKRYDWEIVDDYDGSWDAHEVRL